MRYYLLTMAGDLADRIDYEMRERSLDVELKASEQVTVWAVEGLDDGRLSFRGALDGSFNRFVQKSGVYDLALAVDADGRLVASNRVWPDGTPFAEELLAELELHDFAQEPWFREVLAKKPADKLQVVLVEHHVSTLVPRRVNSAQPHPENYHVGFAAPVYSELAPDKTVGAVFALMNWSHIQSQILRPKRTYSEHLESPDSSSSSSTIYKTSYAWLWKSDGDTIIAHPSTALYTKRVSQPPVNLPQLVAAARSADADFFPEYTFNGVLKNAAFKHCQPPEKGGLGWIVGVGIDNPDVTAFTVGLRSVLVKATLLVLAIVLLLTVFVARRTTQPISVLREHTQRVARGDLDARIDVRSRDELGELGLAFNEMTRELAESRVKLIKAEKDAAWREMARQVAHEIKNPLTPISLSASLLKRAKEEHSPEFDAIFDRTIALVTRQVEHMRRIASDFSAFAGARKRSPEMLDAGAVLDEVLAEVAAWAADARVTISRTGSGGRVYADPNELRRVFLNLVSNSIEAMPQGGELRAHVERVAGARRPELRIEVRDNGVGLSDTVRARLFEPYFTTRTHGTGLGLAISARLVDEMNGKIELENVPGAEGRGTIARVTLPEHADGASPSAERPA